MLWACSPSPKRISNSFKNQLQKALSLSSANNQFGESNLNESMLESRFKQSQGRQSLATRTNLQANGKILSSFSSQPPK